VDFVMEKFNNKQLAVKLFTIYQQMSVHRYAH